MQKNDKTNNLLYIEFDDFISAGWKEGTVTQNNWRNGSFWIMMKNPNDGRMPMVQFESMRPSVKNKLNAFYGGNVYDHLAKVPIKKLVVADAKAEQFFKDYSYSNNLPLPFEQQSRYTHAAGWLNMILKVTDDKTYIKKQLNLTIDQFWTNVISIIKTDKVDLPSSYGNLVSKGDSAIKQYKESGYQSLIHKNYGNKSAAKIGKTEDGYSEERAEQQVAVIRKVARAHMNLDNVQTASFANSLFKKNGWSTVSVATVANMVATNMPNIIGQKKGNKVYQNKVAMQVKREAPAFPTHYWTLDGWTVELLYRDGNTFNNRLVMVVVLDATNKYPVGYAIGERENTELIRMALRNAVIHMQDLFGATYRPWQLQSDRYAIKNLTPFYGAISHLYTPAAVGNAKSKIIEPYFKHLNKTHCQVLYNWSGFNITSSKENQPNIEKLNQIKLSLPDKAGVIDQINKFMLKERLTKVEDYRSRWDAMPQDDQVTLTPTQCLEVFGKAHTELNSIIGLGLVATLEGEQMTFDSFDPAFRALQFTSKFKIIYDSCDYSNVLAITEDGKQKFILHNKLKVGMGFKNTTPEQLQYHQQIRDFNAGRKEEILQTYLSDDAIVEDIIANTPLSLTNDSEAALKLMFTMDGQQKERLQDAKGLRKVEKQIKKAELKEAAINAITWTQQQQEYLNSKTDLNQYLD